jgi:predicted nucleotidyltransferase
VIIFSLFPWILLFTIVGYIVMSLILKDKPSEPVTEKFASHINSTQLLDDIEIQLNGLEKKVISLENYVISEAFEFQCKLWALKSEKY